MFFLLFRAVPFDGKGDADQFHQICCTIGTPAPADWPAIARLPNAVLYLPRRPIARADFRAALLARAQKAAGADPTATQAYVDLMLQMLQWNPKRRVTAERALEHPLFAKVPREEGVIVMKELHQKERPARPFCDFLLEEFNKELELPKLVPPCDL
jgi:serine/threonine protein kinase